MTPYVFHCTPCGHPHAGECTPAVNPCVEVYDSVALKLKPVLTRSIILGVPQPGTWWEVEERLADGTWVKPALPNPVFYQVIRQDPNGEISINTFVGSKLPWVQHVPTNYWTDAGLGISRFVASPGLVP